MSASEPGGAHRPLLDLWLEDALSAFKSGMDRCSGLLLETAGDVAASIASGGKLLICGNGGSAADAQHIAAEFVNRFRLERRPLPALALTTDTSVLTSIANDYGFDEVFSKQVLAFGARGDVLFAISTSGASPNICRAMEAARKKGIGTVLFTGGGGGAAAPLADRVLRVPSADTPRIQEVHIFWGHVICDLVERILFPQGGAPGI